MQSHNPPWGEKMQVLAMGSPAMLNRPCVDCGLFTGRFCDYCLASDRLPDEVWAAGQMTPLCSNCENKHQACHFCRGASWCTPPPHRRAGLVASQQQAERPEQDVDLQDVLATTQDLPEAASSMSNGEECGSEVSQDMTDYDDCVEEIESHICEMKELVELYDEWAMMVEESKEQTELHQQLKAWSVRLEKQIGRAEDFMMDKKSFEVTDKFRMNLACHMSDVILPQYEFFRCSMGHVQDEVISLEL